MLNELDARAWAEAVTTQHDGEPLWIYLADHPEATEKARALLRAYLDAALPEREGLGVWPDFAAPSKYESHAASDELGKWMSAALDDPGVAPEMKADINAWFAAGQPLPEPSSDFEVVAARAWDFVRPKLAAINSEKGPAGVWSNGFRSGWTHALSAPAERGVEEPTADEIRNEIARRQEAGVDARVPMMPPEKFNDWTNADLRAGSRAAPPPPAGMVSETWHSMESAPKDGRRIILDWGGEARVGYYLDNSATESPWQGWKVPSMEDWPSGLPRRWMPLPTAAASGQPAQGDGT